MKEFFLEDELLAEEDFLEAPNQNGRDKKAKNDPDAFSADEIDPLPITSSEAKENLESLESPFSDKMNAHKSLIHDWLESVEQQKNEKKAGHEDNVQVFEPGHEDKDFLIEMAYESKLQEGELDGEDEDDFIEPTQKEEDSSTRNELSFSRHSPKTHSNDQEKPSVENPIKVIDRMTRQLMTAIPTKQGTFVVDGYPNRSFKQDAFLKQFAPYDETLQQPHPDESLSSTPTRVQATVPATPPGVMTRLAQSLFGGMGTMLSQAYTPPLPSFEPNFQPALPSFEERLQLSRENRAMEHILALEEKLDTCWDAFDSIRTNPIFGEALEKVEKGEMDKKDFFLALARSSKSGPLDFMKLESSINNFHASIGELGSLTQQVERSCEKAGMEPGEVREHVEDFLNVLKNGPEGKLMPDSIDGATIAEKMKKLFESLIHFFRRDSPEEDAPGPSM